MGDGRLHINNAISYLKIADALGDLLVNFSDSSEHLVFLSA